MMTQEQYFSKYGRKIWENGYTVLPLQPNTKVPGRFESGKWRGFEDWASYCTKPNISLEIDAWENWPNAGICVPLGSLVAVDIDIDDDEELSDNIERVARSTLGDTNVIRIGKYPKKMLFYRNNDPIKKMRLGPIEILGVGQQAAAHGIHPDTRAPYSWPRKKLYEVRFLDLIEVTESQLKNFLDYVQPYLPNNDPKNTKIYTPGAYTPNDMLGGDLEAITDALKWIINSDLHYDEWMRILMSVKGALGDAGEAVFLAWSATSVKDIVDISERSFRMAQPTMTGAGTIYHLAQVAGWNPPPTIHFNEEKKSIAENLNNELKWIDAWLDNSTEKQSTNSTPIKENAVEEIDETAFPAECLEVDGLLGELCKWINQTAVIYQPVMTLMNSIAALSTVYGRKFYLEDRATRTNVMVLLLANTATGKDHSRSSIKKLFAASNGDGLMMGDVLNSEPGILRALSDNPRRLAMVDEFGQFLSIINSKNATSHQAGIVAALMKLYSSSGSIYHGADYADESREPRRIHYPSLSLYGTTTLADFENNLTDKNLASGFLNRFMTIPIFKSNRKIQKTRRSDPPPHLIDAMKTAIEFDVRGENPGNLEGIDAEGTTRTPTLPVFWGEDLDDLRAEIDQKFEIAMERADKGDPLGNLWGRYVENIYKLCMIRALSRSIFRPVISRSDLTWAQKIMDWSLVQTETMIEENASNSFAEADIKKVLGYVRQAGERGIKHRDLVRKIQRMSSNNRKNAISTLLESEQIYAEQGEAPNGKMAVTYKATN